MSQKSSYNNSEYEAEDLVFEKKNYQIMITGLAVIILGFLLMSGSTDIMSFRKIVIAPCVALLGFAIEFYAIFYKKS